MHTNSELALNFYKKFDFEVVKVLKNYYKRLEKSDAFYLSKKIIRETNWFHFDFYTHWWISLIELELLLKSLKDGSNKKKKDNVTFFPSSS